MTPPTSAAQTAPAAAHKRRQRIALFAGLGVAVIAFVILRRQTSTSSSTDTTTLTPLDTTDTTGTTDTGTTDTTTSDLLTSFVDTLNQRLDESQATQEQMATEVSSLADTAQQALQAATDALSYSAPAGTDTSPTGQQTAAAPVSKAVSKGFWWGIFNPKTKKTVQTWVTSGNKSAFLAELKRTGTNLDTWAAKHKTAARAIGITPPATAPPKQAAVATAPAQPFKPTPLPKTPHVGAGVSSAVAAKTAAPAKQNASGPR